MPCSNPDGLPDGGGSPSFGIGFLTTINPYLGQQRSSINNVLVKNNQYRDCSIEVGVAPDPFTGMSSNVNNLEIKD